MTASDLDALVTESRTAQGLPPKVVDPAALRRLAGLFNDEGGPSQAAFVSIADRPRSRTDRDQST